MLFLVPFESIFHHVIFGLYHFLTRILFVAALVLPQRFLMRGVIPIVNIDNVAVTITKFCVFRFYHLFIISLRYISRYLKYEYISNRYYLHIHIIYLHIFTQFNINILIYIRKWIHFNSIKKKNNQMNVWEKTDFNTFILKNT